MEATKENFRVQLSKIQTKPDDVIIVKFTEDVSPESFQSLQQMIGSIRKESGFEDVKFVVLPNHISLTRLEEEDMNKIGYERIKDE